jgi:hypothetical protein
MADSSSTSLKQAPYSRSLVAMSDLFLVANFLPFKVEMYVFDVPLSEEVDLVDDKVAWLLRR